MSGFGNRVAQDWHDGLGFRLEHVIWDTAAGAALGGIASKAAHGLLPKSTPRMVDMPAEQRFMAMAVTVPEKARSALSAGVGDVAAIAVQGGLEALRATAKRPRDEQCDRLSATCYR